MKKRTEEENCRARNSEVAVEESWEVMEIGKWKEYLMMMAQIEYIALRILLPMTFDGEDEWAKNGFYPKKSEK